MKKSFKIPLYTGRVTVVQTDDFHLLEKEYGIQSLADTDAFVYNCSKSDQAHYLIAFRYEKCTHGYIAHETVHLVNEVFKDHGIALDVINDEPQAYLTEFFIEKLYSMLELTE